jgi:two-component system, NarL family, nitrate/nitrite response regulator NarL
MAFTHNAPIRIIVADDHPTFRDGLTRLLETNDDLKVVGAASDGEDALKLVAQLQPDLLLLDVAMPRMTGLVALRELHDRVVRTRTILVTASIDRSDIVTALQLGAHGIVLKDSASEMLFKSIRAVVAGHHWLGRNRIIDLAATLRELAVTQPRAERKVFGLTPREIEIISVVIGGSSNGDIAARFSISEKTVKHHLTNIFDKLGVSNRLELALFAVHHRIGIRPPGAAEPPPPAVQVPTKPQYPMAG